MANEKRASKLAGLGRRDTKEEVEETIGKLTNHEAKISRLNFDYSNLEMNEEDKLELIDIERELKHHEKRYKDILIDIGLALSNAREIFIKSHSESFVDWYSSIGLNKDQVSIAIGRYQLTIEHPSSKERILELSDVAVKEVLNKKTPEELLKKVLDGEITSGKEIKKERENISNQFEIFSEEIEEAEIVEGMIPYGDFEKIFTDINLIFVELEDLLLRNGGTEKQYKIAKEILEMAKKLK